MINNTKLDLIYEIKKYNSYFRATNDLKWMLRSAETTQIKETIYPVKKPANILDAPQVRDFLIVLKDAHSLIKDGTVNDVLNEITSQVLIEKYSRLDQNLPALNSLKPDDVEQGLKGYLLPLAPGELEQLQANMLKLLDIRTELSPKLRSEASNHIANDKILKRGVRYILTVAYMELLKKSLIDNPVLLLFSPNMLGFSKTASLYTEGAAALNPAAPRLTDLIDALKIVRGRLVREYNQVATYDRANREKINELAILFGNIDGNKKRSGLTTLPKTIAMVSGYIGLYEKMLSQLQKLYREYPEFQHVKDPKTKEEIGPNPYVLRLNNSNPESLVKLLAQHDMFKNLDLRIEDWAGQTIKIEQILPNQKDIAKTYFQNMVAKPNYAETISTSLSEDAMRAAHDYEEFSRDTLIGKLKELLKNKDRATAIYADITSSLKEEVQQARFENKDLFDAASGEVNSKSSLYLKKYDTLLAKNIIKMIDILYKKYGDEIIDPSAFKNYLFDILNEFVWPITPYGQRYLYQAKYEPNFPSDQSIDTFAISTSKVIGGLLGEVFNTKPFKARAETNRIDYEANKNDRDNHYIISVQKGLVKLKNDEALLTKLGIDSSSFEYTVGTDKQYEKVLRENFATKTNELLSKSPEQLQALLGDIPLDALYAYLGEKYMGGLSDALQKQLLYTKSFGGPGGASSSDSGISKKDMDITRYIDEYFGQLKPKLDRGGHPIEDLSQRTAAGIIKLWHQDNTNHRIDKPDLPASYPRYGHIDINKFIMNNAHTGLGSYIHTYAQNYINSILKENKTIADTTGEITDKNWDDPNYPRPRNLAELAHVVGAFADPMPGIFPSGKRTNPLKYMPLKKRVLKPGEKIEDISANEADTIYDHIKRMYSEAGMSLTEGMPIHRLRDMFNLRRKEIVEADQNYTKDIKVYNKHLGGSIYDSPFLTGSRQTQQSQVPTYNKEQALALIKDLSNKTALDRSDTRELRERINKVPDWDSRFSSREIFASLLAASMWDWEEGKRIVVLEQLLPGQGKEISATQHSAASAELKLRAKQAIDTIRSTDLAISKDLDMSQVVNIGRSVDNLQSIISILIKQIAVSLKRKIGVGAADIVELTKYGSELKAALVLITKTKQAIEERIKRNMWEKEVKDGAEVLASATQGIINQMVNNGYDKNKQDAAQSILISLIHQPQIKDLIAPNKVGRFIKTLNEFILRKAPLEPIFKDIDSLRVRSQQDVDEQDRSDEIAQEFEQYENVGERDEEENYVDDGFYHLN